MQPSEKRGLALVVAVAVLALVGWSIMTQQRGEKPVPTPVTTVPNTPPVVSEAAMKDTMTQEDAAQRAAQDADPLFADIGTEEDSFAADDDIAAMDDLDTTDEISFDDIDL